MHERRSVERRVGFIKWGKRLGVVAGIGAALWLVLMSPFLEFDPADVEASGFGTVVDEAAVEAILETHDGTALAMLNTSHVESQIGELVGVSAVQVERVWPTGLRVAITPSEPVAAIPAAEGFALVTETGEQVNASDDAPTDLPVVDVPVGEDNERILSGVLGVLERTPADLRGRIENVQAETEDSIHFVLRDGPRVEWGSVDQTPLKAEVLQTLLDSEAAEGATVIDVSAPTLPTVVKD